MSTRLALLWLALTVLSNGWRLLQPTPAPEPSLQYCEVSLGTAKQAQLPYRAFGNQDDPALLLLAPATAGSLALARAMAQQHHVVLTDPLALPTTHQQTPASTIALLSACQGRLHASSPAHLIAQGHSAPLAAQLASAHPGDALTLQLLAPRGIGQLEGLGEPHLNELIHLATAWTMGALRWGTPHFGVLDRQTRNGRLAPQLLAKNQPTLPATLRGLAVPTQILIGSADQARAHARASEYFRLIPHSTQRSVDGTAIATGLTIAEVPTIATSLSSFLGGAHAERQAVSADRLRAAAAPFDWSGVPSPSGRQLLLLLALLVLATYITEDLTCITAGLLVARGILAFWPATLACLLGIFTGDIALYFLGRALGRRALKARPLRWLITPQQLARSERWFARRGAWVIILSRFVPGSRVPCYVSAGLLAMPIARFVPLFAIAAGFWTPLLVGLAWLVGDRALLWLETWGAWGLPLGLLALLALYLSVRIGTGLSTHRGRRLLYASWQRRVRWEFWPPWLFYPPIVLYILYLGLRHRGLTVFTAANPAMPAGGFVGESKTQILEGLGHDHPHCLPAALLPDGDTPSRAAFVARFAGEHDLRFP